MNFLLKPLVFILFACALFSCEKENNEPPVPPTPTSPDTTSTVPITPSKMIGYWRGKYLEQELYEGNVMIKKTVITSNINSMDFKADSTYTSIYETQAPEKGSWDLISTSYLRLDKGKPNERYYHIITLDEKNLVYRGPFDAYGNLKFGYLITVYSFK